MSKQKRKKRELPQDTMQALDRYLAFYGLPPKEFHQIRLALTQDALQQADDLKYDRILSAIGLALHEEYNFGAQRICRVLERFDHICGSVNIHDDGLPETEQGWIGLMEKLKNETGIVIATGDDNYRIFTEANRE